MKNKTYNGWCNYETWNVSLWINNERSDYERWNKRAAEQWFCPTNQSSYWSASEAARFSLADELKEAFEEQASELIPIACCHADLLLAALSEVNWNDIADSILESLDLEGYESTERANV